MKTKKFLATILAAVMLMSTLTIGASAASPAFTDVPESHWAYESIEQAAAAGIVNGIGNNLYAPSNTVTFVQFATMVARYFSPDLVTSYLATQERMGDKIPYSYWWYPYVEALSTNSWRTLDGTKPYDNYTASGKSPIYRTYDLSLMEAGITRYDMAVIMHNVMLEGFLPEDTTVSTETKNAIADWSSVPSEYQLAVARCYEANLLNGVDSKGTFGGEGIMSRAQAATVMCRLIAYKNGEDISSDNGNSGNSGNADNNGASTVTGGKDANGYTTAASVNSVKDRGKSDAYPTMGGASIMATNEYYISDGEAGKIDYEGVIEKSQIASNNGYYTGANVDLGNSVLVYDFLDMVNEARKSEGLNELEWVPSDAAEEYTLVRAKDIAIDFSHFGQHAGFSQEVIAQGFGGTEMVFQSWMESTGHRDTLMDSSRRYLCAANNGYSWIITVWTGEFDIPRVEYWAPSNYLD